MKRFKLTLLFVTLIFCLNSKAQVGIGNANPNPGSILDLTNANNLSLLLPESNAAPNTLPGFDTEGMIFYYADKLYLKTSTGFNVLSPWLYDGTAANGTYVPSGLPVGIGTTPVSTSNLKIASGADITLLGSDASIVIGDFISTHLLIDNDEIMVKLNANTGGVLKLQDDGGTVSIRSGAAATTNTVLNVNGSINAAGTGKVLQNGLDLVPVGTIVMWNGAVDASGYPLMGATPNTNWHICDGTLGTPDLRERFVVGAGGDNSTVPGTGYTLGNNGGENFHALTIPELPVHSHTGSTNSAGAHTHDVSSIPNGGEGYVGAYNSSNEVYKWAHTGTVTSSSDGSHTHTLSVDNSGSGTPHENRPPYYALIYIMKI